MKKSHNKNRKKKLMDKQMLANELHIKGYNCAQSVVCAFCDELGLDKKTAFMLAEGLGLGGGCEKGVCGALTAACMLAGMKSSSGNLTAPNSKRDTYKIVAEFTKEFEEKAGSIICGEIKGGKTGKVLCSCPECISIGTELFENYLNSLK